MIQPFPTTSLEAATRIWQLQQAAYRVEAELIGWDLHQLSSFFAS